MMAEESTGLGDELEQVRDDSDDSYPEVVWLSTLKAANRMGITTRTLYRFIDRGDLPAYRFGRVIRLQLADIDRFVEQCRVEPGSLEHLYPEARPQDLEVDED
ncbi:helix-turn-helix domain-containing protein [Candidatus Poriferisodalis sp.]|uniref:helix-turn-helix domain-containing protein n=1 Tax=Candidatus Poriferisodalis sp. TaxID=3101277 RepID=UPI003D0EC957